MPLSQDELKNLLGDLEINEDTLAGLITLIENHVTSVIKEKESEIEDLKAEHEDEIATLKEMAESYGEYVKEQNEDEIATLKEMAESYGEYVKEQIISKVDDYTEYAISEFINENQEKFERLESFERMEGAFQAIREAFEMNGYPLSPEPALDHLREELAEQQEAYNSLFTELTEMREQLETAEMALMFEEATRDLTETQKVKLKDLSESVSFRSSEEFKAGIGLLVEQVSKKVEEKPGNVVKPSVAPSVAAVLKALGA